MKRKERSDHTEHHKLNLNLGAMGGREKVHTGNIWLYFNNDEDNLGVQRVVEIALRSCLREAGSSKVKCKEKHKQPERRARRPASVVLTGEFRQSLGEGGT